MAHVLIVDDDGDIRATLRLLLEDAGYAVSSADGGAAALTALRMSVTPTVVLLALVMPHVSGLDVLNDIAGHPTPVQHVFVLMTANDRALLTAATPVMTALGVTLVRKPFNVDDILAAIDHAAQRIGRP